MYIYIYLYTSDHKRAYVILTRGVCAKYANCYEMWGKQMAICLEKAVQKHVFKERDMNPSHEKDVWAENCVGKVLHRINPWAK